ncbi:MAG: glycosyltransferase family 2 protein [Acidobacteriota bacterium]
MSHAPMTASPKVACVVLNYNGRDITLEALGSLRDMTYPAFDLIHVDNGSTDDSTAAIQAAYPEVINIRAEENHGPTSGINLGLETGLQGDYDYVLLLNNDIEVEPDFLTELVRVAESDPTIGCVGPKALYYWDRERIWSAGGIVRFKQSVTRERGMKQIDRGQFDHDREVDYVNGCAMLMRRDVLAEIGLFDLLFNFAVEDADWCMRMKKKGYRCWYAHRAVLYHMVSHTAGAYQARRTFYTGRANSLFTRRYAGLWGWFTFVLFTAMGIPAAFVRELPKGNQMAAIAKLRGIVKGLSEPMTPLPPAWPSSQVSSTLTPSS